MYLYSGKRALAILCTISRPDQFARPLATILCRLSIDCVCAMQWSSQLIRETACGHFVND
jgi:hypothetical protein